MIPFLELSEADKASWRDIEITKHFFSYVDMLEASVADNIIANVRKGNAKEAEILSGKLEAYQELKSVIVGHGITALPAAEEEFHDPAELVTK